MNYFLWFGVVIILFGVMHYLTELSGRQKWIITLILTLIVTGAILYNMKSDREREAITELELKYRHGETILCQKVEVNASTFSYSEGTQSFVGNKGTPHYQQIFNARECQ